MQSKHVPQSITGLKKLNFGQTPAHSYCRLHFISKNLLDMNQKLKERKYSISHVQMHIMMVAKRHVLVQIGMKFGK